MPAAGPRRRARSCAGGLLLLTAAAAPGPRGRGGPRAFAAPGPPCRLPVVAAATHAPRPASGCRTGARPAWSGGRRKARWAGQLRAVSSDVELLGRDLLIFLATTVAAVPISQRVGITPILGFIIAGVLIGPAGLSLVGNTEADVELGDFGILFLLFNEGLELSVERFNVLVKFALSIGLPQVTLVTASIALALSSIGIPLSGIQLGGDASCLFIVSAAGALSSSAFALPVLRDNGWEERRLGLASCGVLLLQDLLVAPLLVVVPLVQAGNGWQDVSLVLLKSLLGFGAVVVVGSFLLKKIFELIADTRSMDTFVATALLVAVGMGSLAQACGLSNATGAFAAGVLLAGTDYRAQIQADIRPFQGILLGIFFMTAGAGLDPGVVIQNWPTVLSLVVALVALKAVMLGAILLFSSLSIRDRARMSLLLAGGGEFAFVLFSLAKDLQVLPVELSDLLNAVIILSMSLTPLLGRAGDALGAWLEGEGTSEEREQREEEEEEEEHSAGDEAEVGAQGIIVCGFGDVGQGMSALLAKVEMQPFACFDLNPARVSDAALQGMPVLYGDGASPKLMQSAGLARPKAIVIVYSNQGRRMLATRQLRRAFPGVPIIVRARSEEEGNELLAAGADSAVAESTEVALRLSQAVLETVQGHTLDEAEARAVLEPLMDQSAEGAPAEGTQEPEDIDLLAMDSGLSHKEVKRLYQVFTSVDLDGNGELDPEEVRELVARSLPKPVNDRSFRRCMEQLDIDRSGTVTFEEFLSVYGGSA